MSSAREDGILRSSQSACSCQPANIVYKTQVFLRIGLVCGQCGLHISNNLYFMMTRSEHPLVCWLDEWEYFFKHGSETTIVSAPIPSLKFSFGDEFSGD